MARYQQLIGKTYPAIMWTPEAERLKQFASLTQDTCYASNRNVMQPMGIVLATVPFGVRQVVDDRELIDDPTRLAQLLHFGEDIQWTRSIRIDETLQVQAKLLAVETTLFGDMLQVQTTLTSNDDKQVTSWVARCVTTLLIRERRPGAPRPLANAASMLQAAKSVEEYTLAWNVPLGQSEKYARVSGDHNPIHLDDKAAKNAGLKGRVLHGLCTLSFAQSAVCQGFLKQSGHILRHLSTRFKRPVYMQDTLEFVGERREDDWILFVVRNQHGQLVLDKGIAKIG